MLSVNGYLIWSLLLCWLTQPSSNAHLSQIFTNSVNTPERKARRSEVMYCGNASHAACTQVALRRKGHNLVNDEVRRLYRVLEEDSHSQV
jgi:hypothetical protein